MPPRIAIFCAIEEEIRPLVKSWQRRALKVGARSLPSYEGRGCLAVCVGMGAEPGRLAAEAVLEEFRPELMVSAGFAGALAETLQVGELIRPAALVDEVTGRRVEIAGGKGIVVSSPRVAGPRQKRELAARFAAQAVDMEGAAVALVAAAYGVRFMAVKAVSDELDFPLPDFSLFTDSAGQLQRGRLIAFAMLRPWLWPRLMRLSGNCRRAARELCRALQHLIFQQEELTPSLAPDSVAQPGSH